MSVEAVGAGYGGEALALRLGEDNRGDGWVMFAGVMLLVAGSMNIIEGIAAIGNSSFFASKAHYLVGDLKAWGWIALLLGMAQALAGLGVLVKNQFARWAGVGFAMLNATAQLLFIQASPYWALAMFTVDILVIYGLTVYGGLTVRPV